MAHTVLAAPEPPSSLFKVRRRFKLGGEVRQPGDIIDFEKLDLPPGRGEQLVRMRYGTWLSTGVETKTSDRVPVPEPVKEPQEDPPREFPALSRSRMQAMRKPELVEECERRGLPTGGNRPDLIDRLMGAGTPS